MTNPTPAQPIPDPVREPGTKGATGGPSITGEVHVRRDHDDDRANGSRNLEQKNVPDAHRDGDVASHGSR